VANNWQVIASFAICFVPVIGPAYMLASAVAGQDLLTGTKLAGPERFLFALGGLALVAKAASSLAKVASPMFKALGRFSSGLGKLFSGVKDGQLAARVGEITSSIRASMGEGVFARALSAVGNTAREIGSAIARGARSLGRGMRGLAADAQAARGDANTVYRAVNEQDLRTIAEGRGIIAKSAEGTWSVGEHVELGSSRAAWANDPWIATTRNLDVARAFERNGIVAIDLTRVPSQQVEAWRIYPRTNPAYLYSIWQEEVSVRAFIPQDAIVGWVG
jgi:hypothetical protein